MSALFKWLATQDEPRVFLHGKGGSGKTAIAYEFARLIKQHGQALKCGADRIDSVLFLSAKERHLLSATAEIAPIAEPDFVNEGELYQRILFYGGWSDDLEAMGEMDIPTLRKEITAYFDLTSNLIVIDDIDTLTTKSVESGMDFLYRALSRSKRESKLLYTQRNIPTHSLGNAIEVPGLKLGEEYEDFVSECVRQFGVKQPAPAMRDGPLADKSERRPLVVESLIALTRNSGSYERALQLFEQTTGDNVRDYVFRREWDNLTKEPLAKFVLAALSELNRPTSFEDLLAVLQADASAIKDGIAAIREMFLVVSENGGDAVYQLAPLTRQFVSSQASALDRIETLRQRIKVFKKAALAANPQIAKLTVDAEARIRRSRTNGDRAPAEEAWKIVKHGKIPLSVREDPTFRSLLGFVAASQAPPLLQEARDAFKYCMSMNAEPAIHHLRAWFAAERDVRETSQHTLEMTEFVQKGRSYTSDEKFEFLSRRAVTLFHKAKQQILGDPDGALTNLVESIVCHLRVYKRYCDDGDGFLAMSEEFAVNSAHFLFSRLTQGAKYWAVCDVIGDIAGQKNIYLDPLEVPIAKAVSTVVMLSKSASAQQRAANKISALAGRLGRSRAWLDDGVRNGLLYRLSRLQEAIQSNEP